MEAIAAAEVSKIGELQPQESGPLWLFKWFRMGFKGLKGEITADVRLGNSAWAFAKLALMDLKLM